jgi:putative lipase involved disintegration of autophagic bodies
LTFNPRLQTNNYGYTVNNESVTIKVDGASHIESGNLSYSKETETETTGNWWNRTTSYYITELTEFTIQDVSITGDNIDEDTSVTITITLTTDRNQTRSVEITRTIGQLGLTKQ